MWAKEHISLSLVFLIPALQTLWGPGDYREEMNEMLAEQAAIETAPPKSPLQLLRDRTVRWQLMSMSIIYCCNQLSGMSAVWMEKLCVMLMLASQQWWSVKIKPILVSFPDHNLLFWHLPEDRYTERQDPLRHTWSWNMWNHHLNLLRE